MKEEVERKFLVREMPDLGKVKVEEWERYFLELGNVEVRISRIDKKYYYERKTKGNGITSEKEIEEITKEKFEELKKKSIGGLCRKSYLISENPEISIKIYEGNYRELIRAEFGFADETEAKKFVPPSWVGEEITESKLGRDGKLIALSRKEFLDLSWSVGQISVVRCLI